MKKQIFLFLFCTIFLMGSLSALFCYQEQTNEISEGDGICGLSYTGEYSWLYGGVMRNDTQWFALTSPDYVYVHDKNFSTAYGIVEFATQFINYTIPENVNSAIWIVKSNFFSGISEGTTNFSISSDCLNSENILSVAIQVKWIPETDGHTFVAKCFNGTEYKILQETAENIDNTLYEEAILWDLNYTEPQQQTGFTPTGQAVYEIMSSAGAGLGLFLQFMGLALPPLLIILGLIGVIVVIAYFIVSSIKIKPLGVR